MNHCREQAEKTLSGGTFIDPHNTSLTQYNAASLKSRKETLDEFADPVLVLARHEKGGEA